MVKIISYNVSDESAPLALAWAKRKNIEVKLVKETLNAETVKMAQGYDGVTASVNAPLDAAVYGELEAYGIRQIAQRSAGFDYYDLNAAKEHHLIISNVPSYSPESIAEFVVMQTLELVRKAAVIRQRVAEHDFRWQPVIRGKVLGEMTVGVIGTGRIGKETARIFKGFGAKVIGFDMYPSKEAEQYLTYKSSVAELLAEADIVTLHTPATKDNYHQFNAELFKQFKKGAYFINAARGSLVQTADLLAAIAEGQIAGAALDTYEGEIGLVPRDNRGKDLNDPLFDAILANPHILYTPHIAYYTDTAIKNLMETGLEACLAVIETGDCPTRVN